MNFSDLASSLLLFDNKVRDAIYVENKFCLMRFFLMANLKDSREARESERNVGLWLNMKVEKISQTLLWKLGRMRVGGDEGMWSRKVSSKELGFELKLA